MLNEFSGAVPDVMAFSGRLDIRRAGVSVINPERFRLNLARIPGVRPDQVTAAVAEYEKTMAGGSRPDWEAFTTRLYADLAAGRVPGVPPDAVPARPVAAAAPVVPAPAVVGDSPAPPIAVAAPTARLPRGRVIPAVAAPVAPPLAPAAAAPAIPVAPRAVAPAAPVAPVAVPVAAAPAATRTYTSFADTLRDRTLDHDIPPALLSKMHAQALGLQNHRLTADEKRTFQTFLEASGYFRDKDPAAVAAEFGRFGPLTREAARLFSSDIRKVQAADSPAVPAAHLRVDGIVGPKTVAALRRQSPTL